MSVSFQGFSKVIKIKNQEKLSNWLLGVFQAHGECRSVELSVVLCSDEELLEINKTYLNHDYYTDIITFPIENNEEELEAELYVSLDRIKDNSKQLDIAYEEEFNRVLVHGVLHLCGFNDKTDEEQQKMRKLEDMHLKELN